MNETRFGLCKEYYEDGNYEDAYIDNETGKTYNFADEFCDYNFLNDVNKVINNLRKENEDLKKEIERVTKDRENLAFISDCSVQVMNEEEKFKEDYLRIATNDLKKLQEENKELKKELAKFKEWEKYVGHVKREELDRVFKMSIYEIAESFEYYKKRIETLEKELEE